jgi:hypothetical protein
MFLNYPMYHLTPKFLKNHLSPMFLNYPMYHLNLNYLTFPMFH